MEELITSIIALLTAGGSWYGTKKYSQYKAKKKPSCISCDSMGSINDELNKMRDLCQKQENINDVQKEQIARLQDDVKELRGVVFKN